MSAAETSGEGVAGTTDPYAGEQPLRRLRFGDGHLGWFTTKHSSCARIMHDSRFVQNPAHPLGGEDGGFTEALLSAPEVAGNLLRIDPPDHTRLRRMVTRYFTVRQVGLRRPVVERAVAARLAAMEEAGPPVDFVRMFAYPVPSLILCDLFGVPAEERDRFEVPTEIQADVNTTAAEKKAAVDAIYEFAGQVIEARRQRPGDDMLSELLATGEVDDVELRGLVRLLFGAGHHTTATMFATSVFFLLSDRARWEAACAEPGERLVEELLRYLLTVNQDIPRTALEDVEVDGVLIRAGEAVAVVPGRPGGDLEACPHLRGFDPARDPAAHLAFGNGRHMCLGQHLARLELEIGLGELMRRLPTLRLAAPAEELAWHAEGLPYNPAAQVMTDALPVTW